MVAERSVNRWR